MKRVIPPLAMERTIREFCSKSMARVAPGFRASGGTAKTAFNESGVMFSVSPHPSLCERFFIT
jgi:hypothetical protein